MASWTLILLSLSVHFSSCNPQGDAAAVLGAAGRVDTGTIPRMISQQGKPFFLRGLDSPSSVKLNKELLC